MSEFFPNLCFEKLNVYFFSRSILEIISAVKEEDVSSVAETVYNNTKQMFFP